MKRKITAVLIAAILILSLVPCAFAETIAEGDCGDGATWVLDDAGTLTISGSGAVDDYGYNEGGMAPWWEYRENVTDIVLENGITRVGNRAFAMLKNLENVSIAGSVTSIGDYAFENVKVLKSITIPDSVTKMGERVFGECDNLEAVRLPFRLTEISDEMFFRCYALKTVNIPNGVTQIGAYAFDECENLAGISLPDGLKSIGEWAFYGCGLKSISIPDGVTSIGVSAFRTCTSLKCVKLPTGIDRIDEYTFFEDTSLAKIAIPDGVEDIRTCAFADCDILAAVKIPLSVICIYDSSFSGSTVVWDVYYSGSEEDWDKIAVEGTNYTGLTDLHYLSYTPSAEVFTQYDYADKIDVTMNVEENKITLRVTPLKKNADLSQLAMYIPKYTSEGAFDGFIEVERSQPDENGTVYMSAELTEVSRVLLWDKELTPAIEPINI